ncbi:MAG: carbohydrate binding domain-containing protein [Chloroflexota bacterium]|nr:carbohydrate binding domain-containing protein [Chloroflexota bacterium]
MKTLCSGSVHIKPLLLKMLCIVLFFSIMITAAPTHAQGIRVIFLHHSCGHNLIEQGDVREGLSALGYEFYDHGYNDDGLRLADGSYTGTNFDVPGDNTDPDGFAEIFSQPLHDPPDNTFSHLMQYKVIAFKSCYPTSNISSDEQLAEYQDYYRAIRDRMDRYPEKSFIIVTQPPEVPGNSDLGAAARARDFVNWLQSDEYLSGHPNIFVFDFFDLLAGEDNFLRADYRFDNYDGHPNDRANQDIGPIFVDFIDQMIRAYQPGEPLPAGEQTMAPERPEPPAEMPTQPPAEGVPPVTSGMVEDFETQSEPWEVNVDELGSTIECGIDNSRYHEGTASLRMQYALAAGGYVGCGRAFEATQDWHSYEGLSMWLRSDQLDVPITIGVFAGDANAPTPFETRLTIRSEDWIQYNLLWADFEKASWAGEGGLFDLDPSQITGYGFSLESGGQTENTIWIDGISLLSGETALPDDEGSQEPAPEDETDANDQSMEDTSPDEPSEEETNGGVCPFSMLMLPLTILVFYMARRRQRLI